MLIFRLPNSYFQSIGYISKKGIEWKILYSNPLKVSIRLRGRFNIWGRKDRWSESVFVPAVLYDSSGNQNPFSGTNLLSSCQFYHLCSMKQRLILAHCDVEESRLYTDFSPVMIWHFLAHFCRIVYLESWKVAEGLDCNCVLQRLQHGYRIVYTFFRIPIPPWQIGTITSIIILMLLPLLPSLLLMLLFHNWFCVWHRPHINPYQHFFFFIIMTLSPLFSLSTRIVIIAIIIIILLVLLAVS